MKWPKVALRDVSLGIYDGPHATPPECEKSGQYFLGIPQLSKDGRIDLSSPRYIADEDYPRWIKRVKPAYGDVVFSYEATLNLYAMIPRGLECCLGRRMGLVRSNAEKLDFRYLYYYFFSDEWRELVAAKTIVGATVDRLSIQDFPTYQISLPPLPIQRKIAEILGAYDDLIENNRRRIALLEKMARELYRERFVRRAGKNSAEFPLERIAKFVRGKVIVKEVTKLGDVPVVAGGLEPAYYHDTANTSAPVVTVSGSGANAGFARMYYEKIWASDCSWVDATMTKYIRFVYCFLKDNDAELRNAQKGAAQPHVHAKDVNALVFGGNEELLAVFEASVTPFFDEIANLTFQNRNLARQRDRLLPRLLSGKIDLDKLVKEGV